MGKKIYVGNLPYSATDDTLNEMFAPHGTVDSAKVIMVRYTNRSKGFGFVEMSTDDEATTAVEALNGQEVEGRMLNVNEAREQAPRSGGFNRGGGGGNRDSRGGGGGGYNRGGGGGNRDSRGGGGRDRW